MNQKQWNLLITSLFAITVILSGICIYQLKMEKDSCIRNPLIYGAKGLSESNNAEFSCTCSLAVKVSPIVTFDQYGMDVKHIHGEGKNYEYNFSIIEDMFVD